MSQREEEILDIIIQILKEELSPEKVFLFGSRAKDKAHKGSDFDVAVTVKRPVWEKELVIKERLEKNLGLYSFDLIYLPETEASFQDIILKTGKLIYEQGN